MRVRRTHRALISRLAVVVAGFYLFGYFAMFAHTLSERHVECPDHPGEMLDVPWFPGANAQKHARGISHDPIRAHHHEHCLLVHIAPRAQTRAQYAQIAVPQVRTVFDEPIIPSLAPRPPPVELLRLAPKQSPPVAA